MNKLPRIVIFVTRHRGPVAQGGPRNTLSRDSSATMSPVSHSQTTSTCQPPAFRAARLAASRSLPRVKSMRSANRAAAWEQDLTRTASYLMGQARTEDERAFVERLYDEALEEGPDFTNYRAKSLFQAAPKLGIDRNAYARILNGLEMTERGT